MRRRRQSLRHRPGGIGAKPGNAGSRFQQRRRRARSGHPSGPRARPGLGLLAGRAGTWGWAQGTGCHRDRGVRGTVTAGSTERPPSSPGRARRRSSRVCRGSISIKPSDAAGITTGPCFGAREADQHVGHLEGQQPGGVSQSPRPGRCWGSCSPFPKCKSPAMPSPTVAEPERRGGPRPPAPRQAVPPPPWYSRAVGGDGWWRRRSPEGVVDGASSSP